MVRERNDFNKTKANQIRNAFFVAKRFKALLGIERLIDSKQILFKLNIRCGRGHFKEVEKFEYFWRQKKRGEIATSTSISSRTLTKFLIQILVAFHSNVYLLLISYLLPTIMMIIKLNGREEKRKSKKMVESI